MILINRLGTQLSTWRISICHFYICALLIDIFVYWCYCLRSFSGAASPQKLSRPSGCHSDLCYAGQQNGAFLMLHTLSPPRDLFVCMHVCFLPFEDCQFFLCVYSNCVKILIFICMLVCVFSKYVCNLTKHVSAHIMYGCKLLKKIIIFALISLSSFRFLFSSSHFALRNEKRHGY